MHPTGVFILAERQCVLFLGCEWLVWLGRGPSIVRDVGCHGRGFVAEVRGKGLDTAVHRFLQRAEPEQNGAERQGDAAARQGYSAGDDLGPAPFYGHV